MVVPLTYMTVNVYIFVFLLWKEVHSSHHGLPNFLGQVVFSNFRENRLSFRETECPVVM